MHDHIRELHEYLQSDDLGVVEDAALELAKITWKEPERIQPTVDRLQEVVRTDSGNAPGKALSALARYGSKVDRSAVETVQNEVSELLEDSRFNQQNALIAATVLGDSQFADQAQKLTHSGDTDTAAAATLTYVRVTDSDLEWLPIRQKHVRTLVSGGTSVLRDEEPEYVLYLMDPRCGESGQGVSARDKLLHLDQKPPNFASMAPQFINEYPDQAVSSLHISILSHMAERHSQTVIDTLEEPVEKVRAASGQKLRQYLSTMANIAEDIPDAIDEGIVEIAREVVADGDRKLTVQAIRLLGAVGDAESRELIEDRMEGGHNKVRSAEMDAFELLPEDSEIFGVGVESGSFTDTGDANEDESKGDADQIVDTSLMERGDLTEVRKRAEDAARENPVREHVTLTSSQYYRSTPVKEYAKARANGMCECCVEPAPFKDKEGEPYLEVHHVDELGDGGADRPDRVVAVCPTCHMRIHYGADGEEMNARLQKKLESGHSDAGAK